MTYKKLLNTIKERLDSMATEWLKEVRKNEYFKTYQRFEDEELRKRAGILYAKLAQWLQSGGNFKESENYFYNLGAERYREGFPLTEVHLALYVTKKIFWANIDWRDTITGSFQTDHAQEIMSILNNYFDLGNFYVTQGYLQTMLKDISEEKCLNKEELKQLLCQSKYEVNIWKA